mmetsp:Transcript_24447/g.67959  ORF Transcript_24447/g.67959 Transcript_24447/m.67959 type:complete len:341 (-) Transcript_24447:1373-2395(-)
MLETSVACATSSMRTPWKLKRCKKSPPALMVVAQITSMSFKISIRVSKSSLRCNLFVLWSRCICCCRVSGFSFSFVSPVPLPSLPSFASKSPSQSQPSSSSASLMPSSIGSSSASSAANIAASAFSAAISAAFSAAFASSAAFFWAFFLSSIASRVMSSKWPRTFSGRPTRAAFIPAKCKPSAMLSTATLLSDVANKGVSPIVFAQRQRIFTETCVFPVPGGPCTMVHRRVSAARTAPFCESFKSATASESFRAVSNFSLWKLLASSAASFAVLLLRAASFLFSTVSASAFKAACWRQGGATARFAQESSCPTCPATNNSLIGSGLLFVHKARRAVICRS